MLIIIPPRAKGGDMGDIFGGGEGWGGGSSGYSEDNTGLPGIVIMEINNDLVSLEQLLLEKLLPLSSPLELFT